MPPAAVEKCSIEVCEKRAYNKTTRYCSMHYRQWKAYGDPLMTDRAYLDGLRAVRAEKHQPKPRALTLADAQLMEGENV